MQGRKSSGGSSTGTTEFDHGGAPRAITAEIFWDDELLQEFLNSLDDTGATHYGSSDAGKYNPSYCNCAVASSSSMQNAAGRSDQKLDNSGTVIGFKEWYNNPAPSAPDNNNSNLGGNHNLNRPLTLRSSGTEANRQNQLTSNSHLNFQNLDLNFGIASNFQRQAAAVKNHFSARGYGIGSLLTGDNARSFDNSHDASRLPCKRKFMDADIGQSSAAGSSRPYQHADGSSSHPIPVDDSESSLNISGPSKTLRSNPGRNNTRNIRSRLSSSDQPSAPLNINSTGSGSMPNNDSGRSHLNARLPSTTPFAAASERSNQLDPPAVNRVALPRSAQSVRRSRGPSSRSANASGVIIGDQGVAQLAEAATRIRNVSPAIIPPDPTPAPAPVQVPALDSVFNASGNLSVGRAWGAGQGFSSGQRVAEIGTRSVVATGGSGHASGSNNQFLPMSGAALLGAPFFFLGLNGQGIGNASASNNQSLPTPGSGSSSHRRISAINDQRIDHARVNIYRSLPMPVAVSSRQPISVSAITGRRNQHAYGSDQASTRNNEPLAVPNAAPSRRPISASGTNGQQRRGNVRGMPNSSQSLAAAGDARSTQISEDEMMLNESESFEMGAESPDRHSDMRLDIDDMSYEELLELEERIGNVNTGLTEEAIMKHLKRRKFVPTNEETEPCCICQDEYKKHESVGSLNCGHSFHQGCVKQWLMVKNLCPVCKTTALSSP